MNAFGLVVIGSGPAGISAAEAFRKHQPDAPIRVITEDADPPYERPPLSKDFLRGETTDVSLHPRAWFTERDIEIHRGTVESISTSDQAVVLHGEPEEPMPYGALVLACGATPKGLPVPGGRRALSLRSLADARRLRDAAAGATSAVVVGAGFIGCEVAASLAGRGLTTTLVAPDEFPQQKRLGVDAGRRLRELVTRSGARYRGGVEVVEVTPDGVRLGDGTTVGGEVVVAATGVAPRTDVAKAAGLATAGSAGSRIVVDQHMRSSAEDVFAAGDVAFARNAVAGRHLAVEHWQDAIEQGAVAGAAAAGRSSAWDTVPGFWTSIGDATVKYQAWGDGYDRHRLVPTGDGFVVWYERGGATVGVLTYSDDDAYEWGGQLIAKGKPPPL